MTTWKDAPDTSTPITAAELNRMEDDITEAKNTSEQALSTANSAQEGIASLLAQLQSDFVTTPVVPAGGSAGPWPIKFDTIFSSIPVVLTGSGDSRLIVEAKDITTTGFNLAVRNPTSAATSSTKQVMWLAVAL